MKKNRIFLLWPISFELSTITKHKYTGDNWPTNWPFRIDNKNFIHILLPLVARARCESMRWSIFFYVFFSSFLLFCYLTLSNTYSVCMTWPNYYFNDFIFFAFWWNECCVVHFEIFPECRLSARVCGCFGKHRKKHDTP